MKVRRGQQIITTLFPGIILLLSFTSLGAQPNRQSRELSLADRHSYQRSLEEVYWRYRIWPKERPDRKPSLDKVMSPAQIAQKVEGYLRNFRILEEYWQQSISLGQLQAEMDRMARNTKQPGMLRELFAALGNDPFVIAECLAKPILAERLVTIHQRDQGISGELRTPPKLAMTSATEYALPTITGTDGFSDLVVPAISSTDVPTTTTGGCTDGTWTATSLTNAPVARVYHSAVWTGSEMIVWGGQANFQDSNTGGMYNPGTDSWVATSLTNTPPARAEHTAVWTGTEMIVWGGSVDLNNVLNTGGRYNPGTDTWTATSLTGAPAARENHVAVWTGSEMIIWGGNDTPFNGVDTGGRYNPGTDSWTATSITSAPTARQQHRAVWTGTEMIVWGGVTEANGRVNTGGRYNPGTDSWIATSVTNAPIRRYRHSIIWTGSEMIVWGGDSNGPTDTGARYNPETDSWTATTQTNAPTQRGLHSSVWTGSEMIVWSGLGNAQPPNTGGRYNPETDSWTATSVTNVPTARRSHTTVWTGSEMIIWGGFDDVESESLNNGGRLCVNLTSTPTTLGNISTRLRVETGNNALIGGFIVSGTQSKNVIVRAIGPSLGVAGLLADPVLELRDSSGALLNSNDNWRDTQESDIIASTVPPTNDLESAIVATLPANNAAYTAVVRGKDNGTGVGLVEVYDLDRSVDSRLANISTRGSVGTGNDVMIGGTIVLGTSSANVVFRGIGPSLTDLGIPDALVDPTLELRDGSGALVVANDNWQDDSTSAAQLTTLGLAPQNPLESGLFTSVPPGFYTIIMAGKNNGTGVGLVEAYHIQ